MDILVEWSTIPGITNGMFLPEDIVKEKKEKLKEIFPQLKNKSVTKISMWMKYPAPRVKGRRRER